MRVPRALLVSLGWSAGAAFVPRPHMHSPFSGAGVNNDKDKQSCVIPQATDQGKIVFPLQDDSRKCFALNSRAIAPVVLVGSDPDILSAFAKHVTGDASRVVYLSDIVEANGSRGLEEALSGGTVDGVMVCHAISCLDQPEVSTLVHDHPLTFHIAVVGEDAAVRMQCERATKYTVVVNDAGNSSGDFDQEAYGSALTDLSRLIAFARMARRSREEVRLDMGKNTFFLSLTFDDFTPHAALLPELTEGVDAMELRVDLLADYDPYSVLHQLSLLRRHTGYLPVVFTVRSKGQCGAFPDDPDALFRLARWGLRAGAEVLDVEANWPINYRQVLIEDARKNYPSAVLVGSYHVVGRKTTEEQACALFMECYHEGDVDAVKVVTTAYEPEDNLRVHAAARSLSLPVPYIGLCLTEEGKLSRVLNERYTPVTHRKLPFVAAPGQMTSTQIMHHRADLGICPRKSFFLFGSPISASPSPDMHNAGFRHSGLPHEYSLCEGEDPSLMAEAMSRADFGGASVTIPHKQNVLPLLDEVSEPAIKIGAVNTVIVRIDPETGTRILKGDNTDWLGILRPVKARLEMSGWQKEQGGTALVIGAGGAAMGALFAMLQLGLKVVVYNRTLAKAEELAGRFGGSAVATLDPDALERACGRTAIDVVVSTIPASSQFRLPDYLVQSKPVVFDAAYKPALTALLSQAKDANCPYVQGADMLVEQGLEQFQLWTQRRAPRHVMEDAVFAKVERI